MIDEGKRIGWEEIFKHPLIKDKDVGEQVKPVDLPIEIVDILRKVQEQAKKKDVDILDALSSAAEDKAVTQSNMECIQISLTR